MRQKIGNVKPQSVTWCFPQLLFALLEGSMPLSILIRRTGFEWCCVQCIRLAVHIDASIQAGRTTLEQPSRLGSRVGVGGGWQLTAVGRSQQPKTIFIAMGVPLINYSNKTDKPNQNKTTKIISCKLNITKKHHVSFHLFDVGLQLVFTNVKHPYSVPGLR